MCKGQFGKEDFEEWNGLLRIAHIQTYKKLKAYEEVRRVTLARIRPGNLSEKGYHFIPETGFSLQGVDANRAWAYSFRLAKTLRTPIVASFDWRNNDKAARPGMSGVLEWNPNSQPV
jgi:HKD family nuclease